MKYQLRRESECWVIPGPSLKWVLNRNWLLVAINNHLVHDAAVASPTLTVDEARSIRAKNSTICRLRCLAGRPRRCLGFGTLHIVEAVLAQWLVKDGQPLQEMPYFLPPFL